MGMNFDFGSFKAQMLHIQSSVWDVFEIAGILKENNIFVAGGMVRDFFRGTINRADIYLFVTDTAYSSMEKLQNSYGKIIKNQFGTDRWFPSEKSEFYFDIIRISDFYNGLWKCLDIIDVLNQFDITANAIAFDLKNGNFFNPVNGLRDCKEKRIRAIRFDYPELFVSETIPLSRNSVLWFRYKHYSKKLGFKVEPITEQWIEKNSFRYKDIELFKKYFFEPQIK